MSQSRQDTREERMRKILDGALKVFSSRGYNETSIKDVAAASDINSPALIYHYFENKDTLLRAVIQQYAPPLKLIAQMDAISELPVRDGLLTFAKTYLQIMDAPAISGCMRVMIGEALRSPDFARVLAEAGPLRIWEILSVYIAQQMDKGQLRQADPNLTARLFIAPLFSHVFIRTMVRMPDTLEIDPFDFAAACVDHFLNGAGPVAVVEPRSNQNA